MTIKCSATIDVGAPGVGAQVIGLLKEAFHKAALDLYLAPYGVLPTDYECGIIEVTQPRPHRPTFTLAA